MAGALKFVVLVAKSTWKCFPGISVCSDRFVFIQDEENGADEDDEENPDDVDEEEGGDEDEGRGN